MWELGEPGGHTCEGFGCSYLSAWAPPSSVGRVGPSVLGALQGVRRDCLLCPQPGAGLGLGQLLIPQMFYLQ